MLAARSIHKNAQLLKLIRCLSSEINAERRKTLKPFSAIPGPKPAPFIGNIWNYLPIIGDFNVKDLKTFYILHEKYGDMVKLQTPNVNTVFLFNPDLIQAAFQKEGKIPNRPGLAALAKHRESSPHVYSNNGLLLSQGQMWKDLRRTVQKHMLRVDAVRAYTEPMSKVANDFVDRMKCHRKPNMEIDDFMNEVLKWALESVGVVALSRRLGCLAEGLTGESESQRVIDSVTTSFTTMHKLEQSLGLWKFLPTPTYRKFIKAQICFETIITKYLRETVESYQNNSSETNSILNSILVENNMDLKRVTSVMLDTFLAGVDTTSVTASFLLYELAINPEKQEKVYQEIRNVIPDKNAMISGEQLDKLVVLNACMKESMRLHPITVGTARCVDKEIELNGYIIPANTQFAPISLPTYRSDKYFKNADKFLPERWMKDEVGRENLPNLFSFIPFSYGPRMCIGFRVAEQEIRILVSKILQNFRLEYDYEPVGQHFGIVLTPDKPIKIKFYDKK